MVDFGPLHICPPRWCYCWSSPNHMFMIVSLFMFHSCLWLPDIWPLHFGVLKGLSLLLIHLHIVHSVFIRQKWLLLDIERQRGGDDDKGKVRFSKLIPKLMWVCISSLNKQRLCTLKQRMLPSAMWTIWSYQSIHFCHLSSWVYLLHRGGGCRVEIQWQIVEVGASRPALNCSIKSDTEGLSWILSMKKTDEDRSVYYHTEFRNT